MSSKLPITQILREAHEAMKGEWPYSRDVYSDLGCHVLALLAENEQLRGIGTTTPVDSSTPLRIMADLIEDKGDPDLYAILPDLRAAAERLETVEAEREDMLAMLKRLSNLSSDGFSGCGDCDYVEEAGHRDDCKLNNLLKRLVLTSPPVP